MNGNKLGAQVESSEMLARQDVDLAFRLLEFALRLKWHIEDEKVDVASFGKDELLDKDQDTDKIQFSDGYFSSFDNVKRISHANVGAAFGVSAITLYNFFEVRGIKPDGGSTDPISTLCCLVYAVRNAFAHGIADPKWFVRPSYQKKLEIELGDKQIVVDLAYLNGQEFAYRHIGGFDSWWKIKMKAIELSQSA